MKSDAFIDFCLQSLKGSDYYFYMQSGKPIGDQFQSETFDEIASLIQTVEQDTDNTGVMMYYGDSKNSDPLSELINALELLQLRGNMLLKVRHLIKN